MILKTQFNDGRVFFEYLGDKFILTSKQRSPNKFEEMAKEWFSETTSHPKNDLVKDCYAFISPLRMERSDIPLYTDMGYELLSERGCQVMRLGIGDL